MYHIEGGWAEEELIYVKRLQQFLGHMHNIGHHLYRHHHVPLHLLLLPLLLGSCPCCFWRTFSPSQSVILTSKGGGGPGRSQVFPLSVFSGASPLTYYLVSHFHQCHLRVAQPSPFVQLLTLVPNMLPQYWTTCKSLTCTIPWSPKTLLLHHNHAKSYHLSSLMQRSFCWVSFIPSRYGIEHMSLRLSQNQYPEHVPRCPLHPLALTPSPRRSPFPCSPSANTHPSPNPCSHVWNPAWDQLTPSYRSLSVSCIGEHSPLCLISNCLRLESTSENSSPSQHLVRNWTQRRFSETVVGWLINWHWSW